MGNNSKPILVNTSFSQRIFSSIQEVMQEYGLSYFKVKSLIDTGMPMEDGKTTVDMLFEEGDEVESHGKTG